MAGTNISVDKDQFSCSVCLEVLWEPVTIPCGHSYCMECIKGYWRKCELKEEYSCPQCRQAFSPRPALSRNTLLSEIVEKLRKTGLQEPATDAECDVCAAKKQRAVKFCVKCQTLYCETHLKLHNERNRGRPHQLIEVPKQAQKPICSRHGKLAELYCQTDRRCVCGPCQRDEHKGHSVVSVSEERMEKQKHLEEAWKKSRQRCKEREKELREIVKYIKRSTQTVQEDSDKVFLRLQRISERKHAELREMMRGEENTALAQTEKLLEKLNQQILEQRRGEAELEALASTRDHVHFLQVWKMNLLATPELSLSEPVQNCDSLCTPSELVGRPSIDVHPYFSLLILRKTLTELRDKVTEICDKEIRKISEIVDEEQDPHHPPPASESTPSSESGLRDPETARTEPRTRGDFLQYCCDLTFKPIVGSCSLQLSWDQTEATLDSDPQSCPHHPYTQIFCSQALSGHQYWEVEWGGSGGVSVGVSYEPNSEQKLGHDLKSWSLDLSESAFRHSKYNVEMQTPVAHRIGVYLDHKAGVLEFYSVRLVEDTMVLLHRQQAAFTQPLYPGFWLGSGSTVKLCRTFSFSA
ncbi:hypothetical protein DNTS_025633 [Danionella cerebrum]|uniref:RING-type E3 ubiquitin transferase n=1 Tax=Danionella cerebrum TaxID=2873325 RepID=A0A553MRH1_9TELE|nr:hypothetical protein DNTS_025633 [Danionella translucida]